MKFLSHDGLLYFWTKVKNYIDTSTASLKTIDPTPTLNSTNFVTSNGIKAAIDTKANSSHTHTKNQITDFPSFPDCLPAKGGDADTVDGKHAAFFTPLEIFANVTDNLDGKLDDLKADIEDRLPSKSYTILHTGNAVRVVKGTSTPSDTSVIWIDTTNKKIKAYIGSAWTAL